MCAKKAKKSQSKHKRHQDGPAEEVLQQVDSAMKLMELAYDQEEADKQRSLAQMALELWPDCVHALMMLAQLAETHEETLEKYEQAVEAGKRIMGPQGLEQYRGHFWYVAETRPYMYARKFQAEYLEHQGQFDQAIAIYQELLELNPGDNQGCRYPLTDLLLRSERLDELKVLLENYSDEVSVWWPLTHALLEFKIGGDTEQARDWLLKGTEMNPYLNNYMLSWKSIPTTPIEYTELGEESEALEYVLHALPAWRETPGALPWYRQTTGATPPPRETRKRFSWTKTRKALQLLPESDAVWELDLVQVEVDDQKNSIWILLIVDVHEQLPLKMDVFEERPDDTELLIEVFSVMKNPDGIEPVRPGTLRLVRKTLHRKWRSKLAQINVEVDLVDEFELLPEMTEGLLESMESMLPVSSDQPIEIDEEQLQELPLIAEATWWVIVRRLSSWIHIDHELKSMFLLLVMETDRGIILKTDLCETPTTDWIIGNIQQTMLRPMQVDPHKPGQIEVESEELLLQLGEPLEKLGIPCRTKQMEDFVDELFESMSEDLSGHRSFALTKCSGMTPEKLGEFYRAAAAYFRFAPWRKVPGDSVIHIHVEGLSNPDWYGVIMGQMGMELGIALYDDRENLRAIMEEDLTDEERGRITSGVALTFGEKSDASPLDCAAIEEYGWPIVNEQAYPTVIRVNPGMSTRMPLLWELELMQATISAIIPWLESKQKSIECEAHMANKQTTLKLYWE